MPPLPPPMTTVLYRYRCKFWQYFIPTDNRLKQIETVRRLFISMAQCDSWVHFVSRLEVIVAMSTVLSEPGILMLPRLFTNQWAYLLRYTRLVDHFVSDVIGSLARLTACQTELIGSMDTAVFWPL